MKGYFVHRKVWWNTATHTFYINEANFCHWRKNYNFIFSCKVTITYFTWMKGKYPEVDEDLLHFITKIYVKGWPIVLTEMGLKEKETAKFLRIGKRNFKAEWYNWFVHCENCWIYFTDFLLTLNRSWLTSSYIWYSSRKMKM